jgi:hypothetical protein
MDTPPGAGRKVGAFSTQNKTGQRLTGTPINMSIRQSTSVGYRLITNVVHGDTRERDLVRGIIAGLRTGRSRTTSVVTE